jgi:hypothetical protein
LLLTSPDSVNPIQKNDSRVLENAINQIIKHKSSFDFRQPVDYVGSNCTDPYLIFIAFGLLDYPKIIKKPMDLGTVKGNLLKNQYFYIEEVLNDLQLIWDNCKTYNQPGSVKPQLLYHYKLHKWIWPIADTMERHTKRLIKNHLSNYRFPGYFEKKQSKSRSNTAPGSQ